MSRFSEYGGWPAYVPVAERRKKAERAVEKMRKKGRSVAPVRIEGRTIASTFWGKAWCENLEGYHDYENRLPRGRTYVRNGSVVDLQISALEVRALVSGSSLYDVSVTVKALPEAHWRSICEDCAGGIDSLVELLRGTFSKGVMERICRREKGLFPKPSEIAFSCSCPDYASMCKHVAAVLYGVGSRLDAQPALLFRLRAVNEKDLIAAVSTSVPLSKKAPGKTKVIEQEDVSAVFGLDMEEEGATLGTVDEAPAKAKKPLKGKKAAPKKPRARSKGTSGKRKTSGPDGRT